MSTSAMIAIVAVAAIVALILMTRDSGPRITTVERRTEEEEKRD